jgi:Ca2+-binding RTX toxin-like protein
MPTEGDDRINIRSNGTIYGLGGADEFRWYSGSGAIYGGDTGEHYDENPFFDKTGGDRLIVMRNTNTTVRFSTTEDGVALTGGDRLVFEGIERLLLGNGNDVVNASNATVERWGLTIWSKGGNDKIIGSRGDDIIDPGVGNDVVRAGAGNDFIQGSKGDDRIHGGAGIDNIRWGWGDLQAVVGNDRLNGGAGNEDLVNVWVKDGWGNAKGAEIEVRGVTAGGSMTGVATSYSGGSLSTLHFTGFEIGYSHEGRDYVNGTNAKLKGDVGMLWNARAGNDVLIGTKGNDTLCGGDGADRITGGRGNDLIVANIEWWNEYAPGDGSRDVLIFRAGDGRDTVYAFDIGIDRIDVGGRRYDVTRTTHGDYVDYYIDLGGGDSINIVNADAGRLDIG